VLKAKRKFESSGAIALADALYPLFGFAIRGRFTKNDEEWTAHGWQCRTTDEEDAFIGLMYASCCGQNRVVSWNLIQSAERQN
jgi:hypothetical protein